MQMLNVLTGADIIKISTTALVFGVLLYYIWKG